jgi:hypothetical protein
MERPLYAPALKPLIADIVLGDGEDSVVDLSAMYDQVVVDKARLVRHIRQVLQTCPRTTLRALIDAQPLERGLAELVAYLQIGRELFHVEVQEDAKEVIAWDSEGSDGTVSRRQAHLPSVVFVR